MLPAGVYEIKEVKIQDNISYQLVKVHDSFNTPKKVYGNTMSNIVRVWNAYALANTSLGVLYTGEKGSGKTTQAMILSNIAIDNNLPVIVVANIKCRIELINYLNSLTKCVILFDEFAKNIQYELQDQTLTMFTDVNNTRKLFILTENRPRDVSHFLLDRPGRLRYHFDFQKLDISVLEDYCKEFEIDQNFYLDLIDIYKKSRTFSFDQLVAIVSEHQHYPNDKLEHLLEVLNLHSLIKPKELHVLNVKNITKKIAVPYRYNPSDLNPSILEEDSWKSYYISIKEIVNPDNDEMNYFNTYTIKTSDVKQDSLNRNEYYIGLKSNITNDELRVNFVIE